jgi:hypothetical protein
MKRYLLPLVIVLVPLAATVLWVWTPRTVPSERVSDLYRRYEHNPHLTVAYIEDFPVDDTLTVDVTTLTATDNEGWEILTKDFNAPVLPDSFLELSHDKEDLVLTYKASSDSKETLAALGVDQMNTIAVSYFKHCVSFFHTSTNEQQYAVLHYNLKQNIKQLKTLK